MRNRFVSVDLLPIPKNHFQPTKPLELLRFIVRPYRKRTIVFFLVTTVAELFWFLVPLVIARVTNHLTTTQEIDTQVWYLAASVGLLYLGNELFWRFADWLISTYLPHMLEHARITLLRQTLTKNHHYFSDAASGQIGHWINHSVSTCKNIIETTIWEFWRMTVGMAISLVLLLTTHWSISLLFFIWVAGIFAFNIYRGKKQKILVANYSEEVSKAAGLVVDSTSNNVSVKTSNGLERETRLLHRQQASIVSSRRKSWVHHLTTNSAKGLSSAAANTSAMLLIVYLFSQNQIGLGSVVLFVAYFGRASEDVWHLSEALDDYYNDFGALQNALDGLNGRSEEPHPNTGASNTNASPELSNIAITFENVTFCYPDQPDQKILDQFNLEIRSGEKLGLVGHSGAGKSTISSLLLKLYDPTEGHITFGGEDITVRSPYEVRDLTAYVPQDSNLFNRSVKDNIAYSNPTATNEEIRNACEQAQALTFIQNLPEGFESLVGERGIKLSGGQKQRIAIARAILKRAPLILLDEATSALDSVSEQAIQIGLTNLMKNKTAIIIAHRLSTLQHLDRIAVINQRQVSEIGTHAELLRLDGLYADLWKRQKDGFIGG